MFSPPFPTAPRCRRVVVAAFGFSRARARARARALAPRQHELRELNAQTRSQGAELTWWQWVERHRYIHAHDPPRALPAFLLSLPGALSVVEVRGEG